MDFIRDDVYFFINKGRLIVPVRQTKIYPQARAHSRRYAVLELGPVGLRELSVR